MGFIKLHHSCELCGSSDAASTDNKGWVKCFSCGGTYRAEGEGYRAEPDKPKSKTNDWEKVSEQLKKAEPKAIIDRGITSATVKKYGVAVKGDGTHIYPYYIPGSSVPTAAKTRVPTEGKKLMPTSGLWAESGLFGQELFSPKGKFVTVTEGETDAMAAYQMQGSKYPCVSVKNGADGALADCKRSFEWLNKFDCIVLAFDPDEAGNKAARQVAELFAGKVKVMKLDPAIGDPVEYLRSNKGGDFVAAFWAAEFVTPDGIVSASSLWDIVNQPMSPPDACYPWRKVNEITYGLRKAELVCITAGSGLGKSQFCREMLHHVIKTTDFRVGGLFLEENTKKTALSLMSLAAGKPLHLPKIEWNDNGGYDAIIPQATEEELRAAFDSELAGDRLFLFDHFGSTAIDNIIARVKYMAKGLGCDLIMLDHVSIVVSAQGEGDERKAIDEIMTKLRMVAQECNIMLVVVSHLKRPDKKGHEEGAATSLAQLRGSGSIGQLSDIVIGLERNGQAEDELDRNTTHVRILKNRFSGETALAAHLLWSRDTGRMTERNMAIEEAL